LPRNLLALDAEVADRARDLMGLGFRAADAVHTAAAERLKADVLATTDERLVKLGKRHASRLHVRVLDVLSFVAELKDADEH
jgi:predicted nucleic acid-binding protein